MELIRGINKPLTREEMRTIGRPVMLWKEERNKKEVVLSEFRNILPFHVTFYNCRYRFWLEEPTEEERAAYEWEDLK